MKYLQLTELAELINGSTPLKSNKKFWDNGTINWFTAEDLRNGSEVINTNKFITKYALDNTSIKLVPKDSVLLCCTASIGLIGINKIELTTNQQFNAIVPNKELINFRYLFYFLKSYMSEFEKKASTTTVGFISQKKVKSILVPVPSIQEQEEIVARLDKVFENISEKLKIEKLRKEELSTLSKSIYDELFNFNSNNLTALSNLVEFENGDRGKNYPSKKYRVKSGIPFINAGDFNLDGEISEEKMEYISDKHYNKLSRGKVRKNDFLLCIRGSLGKFAINNHYSKGAIASSLVIIRPNKLDNIEMLDKYFRSSFFKKQITEKSGGTAQPNLGANQLKDFLIPSSLPKEALYRARKIDILLKQYFENNQKVIEKVNLLKTSLLSKEFSYE